MAALMGLFGLTSVFALLVTAFVGWMAWRIVEKAGLPGWVGLGSILLTLTGVGSIVPMILLWVFAFMRWPRDDGAMPQAGPGAPVPTVPKALAAPPKALAAPKGWRLSGAGRTLAFDGASSSWLITGAAAAKPNELSLSDASVGQPHARLLVAGERLGLEDLGTPGGTSIDGARLLPEHGPRDISAARVIRVGALDLTLSKAGAAE